MPINTKQPLTKDKIVVVSDLHVDTWKDDVKFFGKTKLEHFMDFLDWIEPFTATFVINGDLFDAPPPNDSNLLPNYERVIQRLTRLAKNSKLYYFIGNHDIGLFGLKVKDFRNVDINYVYYPHLFLKVGPKNNQYIYLEHGHFYDPVLNLYIYDMIKLVHPKQLKLLSSLKQLLYKILGKKELERKLIRERRLEISAINKTAARAAQRRDPRTGEKTQPIGTFDWREHWQDVETFLWKKLGPLVDRFYKPFNWREAAGDVFEDFLQEYPEKEIKAITFGHTHMPDEHLIVKGNRQALYLNSGDWSEPVFKKDPDTHHASFIIFDKNGEVERDKNKKAVRDFIEENAIVH